MFKQFGSRMLFLALAPTLIAQVPTKWNVKQTPSVAKANETVVIEIVDLTPSPALQIDWAKRQGEGSFVGETNKKAVTFKPTKPGDVVIIVCNLSGGLKTAIEHTIKVADDMSSQVKDEKPSVQASVQAPAKPIPHPQTPHQSELLPPGAVPIAKIVDPNEAVVIPSGWMGDANTSAVSLVGGTDCKFDVECSLFTYDLSTRKEGWAGFAWQVVPQGEKYNWGEYKGKDLSGRGFKSLRVWAKLEPGPAARAHVEFKSGGNVEPKSATTNRPTYIVSSGSVSVDGDWKEFCLDLSRSDLRNVVSPFTVVISAAYNPPVRIGLYLDGADYSSQPCSKDK